MVVVLCPGRGQRLVLVCDLLSQFGFGLDARDSIEFGLEVAQADFVQGIDIAASFPVIPDFLLRRSRAASGGCSFHELQAAVDQFRHLIWTKIEEANAPSALGTEEALLALRLRRSAEMLRLAGTALKDPRFATDRVLGFVGEIQQAVYGIWDTVGQGTLNAYRAAPLRRGEGAGGS